MKYFYYNEKGEKKGAFSGKEIKALAKAGLINPDTVIETEEGKQYYAHGIGGVEFGSADTKQNSSVILAPTPVSASAQDIELAELRLRILELENKQKEMQQEKSQVSTDILLKQAQIQSQLYDKERRLSTQSTPRPTSVLDIVMALIIFFFGIPAIIWLLVVASCSMR